jgi:hypothetical protein
MGAGSQANRRIEFCFTSEPLHVMAGVEVLAASSLVVQTMTDDCTTVNRRSLLRGRL